MTIMAALKDIRERLLASGLTLRRVAFEASLAENTVAKVARASPRVTVETLLRIEAVLDASHGWSGRTATEVDNVQ